MRSTTVLSGSVLMTAASLFAQGHAQDKRFDVPGTDATVRVWQDDGRTRSAVSRDGGATWFEQYEPRYRLSFRDMAFDPADGPLPMPPALQAAGDNRLFYVQFVTDIIPEYRTALERMGVEVLYHFPYQSYLVRMDPSDVSFVQRQEYVRAIAQMDLAFKVDRPIVADAMTDVTEAEAVDIMLANKRTDAAGVEKLVERVGAKLVAGANGGILVSAIATPDQALRIARDSSVIWVDRPGEAEVDIDLFREFTGINNVVSQRSGQLFGRGMAGHVVEGVYTTHCELQGIAPWSTAPIHVPANGTNGAAGTGHGTGTAGEIFATGTVTPDRAGIMPLAQMYYTNYTQAIINTNNRYAQTQALLDPNGPYKILFQTASWGYSRTTNYTSRSAEMDDILSDFDLLITQSQSNSGSTPSRPQAWAKNVIGVGGWNHFNNLNPNDDCHCNTGSTGPAQDGRVGVTFSSFYDNILTISNSNCTYGVLCCTSGATPTIAGLAGSTIEMWTDGVFGGPAADISDPTTARANRFALRPHYTTTRALMTVSAYQVDLSRATRVEQGWGLPNVQTLYDNRDRILAIDELDVLSQGETKYYLVFVPPGTPEFKVSMHHAEEEAVPNANPTRHNSVDLLVVDPSFNIWRGNRDGILADEYSTAPNGETNDVDIHENIFLENPEPGSYIVGVTAAAVTMDNHKETPQVDLDFGLAVLGIGGGRDKSDMVLDMDSTGTGDWSVSLSNLPANFAGGYTVLSFDTSRPIGYGEIFGVKQDAAALASLGVAPGNGNVFHFTNTQGVYPYTTYQFPAAFALAVRGLTIDAMSFVYDSNGAVTNVSNVDRVTIQ